MATDTTTLIDLLRHGEPEGGPRFRGSLDDPLSELGWQQMQQAIRPGDQWDAIVSSPLRRCRAFAEELARQHSLPLHLEPGLREIGFGDWEGMTAEAIMSQDGEALQRFWGNPEKYPPPAGEALAEFHGRVTAAWYHWQARLAGQRVLLVCHGGVIRMLLGEVLQIPRQHCFAGLSVPYACRSRVRIDRSAHGTFSSLQSHGSLEPQPAT